MCHLYQVMARYCVLAETLCLRALRVPAHFVVLLQGRLFCICRCSGVILPVQMFLEWMIEILLVARMSLFEASHVVSPCRLCGLRSTDCLSKK